LSSNRKPIHLERVGGQGKRDRIWATIRAQREFTIREIHGRLGAVSKTSVKKYIVCLTNSGHVKLLVNTSPMRYVLANDCGIEAPRLRTDGSAVTQGVANENLWRTAKILKTFDWLDLMNIASTEAVQIKETTVKRYVQMLHKAHYLIQIRKHSKGTRAVYRFNPRMNTGNRALKIQRNKNLYDPNLGKIVYSKGET